MSGDSFSLPHNAHIRGCSDSRMNRCSGKSGCTPCVCPGRRGCTCCAPGGLRFRGRRADLRGAECCSRSRTGDKDQCRGPSGHRRPVDTGRTRRCRWHRKVGGKHQGRLDVSEIFYKTLRKNH